MDNAIWFREHIRAHRRRRLDTLDEWVLLVVWLVPLVTMMLGAMLFDGWFFSQLDDLLGWIVLLCGFTQVLYLCSRCLGDASHVIASEREKQTLELLLCSPMSPRRMLWGHFAAVAAPRLAELTICLPLTFELLRAPLALGTREVLGFYLLSCAIVFFFTWLGLLVSCISANVVSAARQAIAFGVLVFVGTFLFDFDTWALGQGSLHASLLNPCTAMFSLFGMHDMLGPWSDTNAPLWLATCLIYGLLGLASWAVATWCLRHAPEGLDGANVVKDSAQPC
jgi:positive regulator of sigma E activity